MRTGLVWLLVILGPIAVSKTAMAQEPKGTCTITEEISAQCQKEFETWVKLEKQWRQWMDKNRNVILHRTWGLTAPARKPRPAPPAWLEGFCARPFESDPASTQICQQYNALKDYDYATEPIRDQIADDRAQKEKPVKSTFLERMHADVLWVMPQYPVQSVFGVIGFHVGLLELGRWQIFGLPGIMLISEPSIGGSKWQFAYTYGGSYKLFDFKLPWHGQLGTLHLDLAEARMIGTVQSLQMDQNLTLTGFSITFKKR